MDSTRRSVLRASAWSVPIIAATVAAPAQAATNAFTITDTAAVSDISLVTIAFTATGLSPTVYLAELHLVYDNNISVASPEIPLLTNGRSVFGVADENTYWRLAFIRLVFNVNGTPHQELIPVALAR